MIFMEDRTIDKIPNILLITLGKVEHGLGISLWGFAQALSFRILSDTLQNRPDSSCKLLNALLCLFGRRLQSLPGARA